MVPRDELLPQDGLNSCFRGEEARCQAELSLTHAARGLFESKLGREPARFGWGLSSLLCQGAPELGLCSQESFASSGQVFWVLSRHTAPLVHTCSPGTGVQQALVGVQLGGGGYGGLRL